MDVGAGGRRGSARLIPGVVLAVVLLAGCASAGRHPARGSSQSAAAATSVRTFAAYDAGGQLAVQVHDVEQGSCWTTSIAAPVAHAYRCLAGNSILDPCFAPASGTVTQVACVAAPWAQAEMLQLTGRLPSGPPAGNPDRPWAFQLSSGVRCVASTGTVPLVSGVDLGYHCTDGTDAALADPAARQVIAEYAPPGATVLQRVAVTTIWRG